MVAAAKPDQPVIPEAMSMIVIGLPPPTCGFLTYDRVEVPSGSGSTESDDARNDIAIDQSRE